MKKLSLSLFFLTVFVVTLVACSPNASNDIQAPENVKSTSSTSSSKTLNSETTPFYVALRPEWGVYGSSNELGFYEIFDNSDKSKNIFYTDYKTLEQIYLCSQPNCEHINEACTSYIAPCEAKVTPAALNDRLLIVYEQSPNGPYIEESNLDGSNKRTLYSFSSGERIERGLLANDSSIIVLVQSVNAKTNTPQYILRAISLDGTSTEDIYYTECKTTNLTDIGTSVLFLFGVTDTGIVVKEISIDNYETVENNSEKTLENMQKATIHTVIEIPFNGGEPKDLISYSQNNSFEEAIGGYLFYLQNDGENKVSLYKTRSDKPPEKIVDNFYTSTIADVISKAAFTDFTIRDYSNNYLFINVCTDYYFADNGDAEVVFQQFAINTSTGELKEVFFSNHYRATKMPIQIVAVLENELLVHYKVEQKSKKGSEIPELERTLALIETEDFVNSIDNFRVIDSIKKAS